MKAVNRGPRKGDKMMKADQILIFRLRLTVSLWSVAQCRSVGLHPLMEKEEIIDEHQTTPLGDRREESTEDPCRHKDSNDRAAAHQMAVANAITRNQKRIGRRQK